MEKKSNNSGNKTNKGGSAKRGFALPTTSSKPPTPPVKLPKQK